jgi:hypothetical protein
MRGEPGGGKGKLTVLRRSVARGILRNDHLHRAVGMSESSRDVAEQGREFVKQQRKRLSRLLQRPLAPPKPSADLTEESRRFLLEEAEELYWNELSWEQITEEEGLADSGLVEFTFPGFLAFTEGLLLREVMPDSLAPARPRPEVVEDILHFLAARCVELGSSDGEESRMEREVTQRLIDLVLYRQHGIDVEEVERLEEETPWGEPEA